MSEDKKDKWIEYRNYNCGYCNHNFKARLHCDKETGDKFNRVKCPNCGNFLKTKSK